MRVTTYGPGGYNTLQPFNNIVDEFESNIIEIPSLEDRLQSIEDKINRTTSVNVVGDAAKIRDALKGN